MSEIAATAGEQPNAGAGAPAAPATPARTKPVVLIGVIALALAAGAGGGFVLAPRLAPSAHAAADAADEHEEAAAEGSGEAKPGKGGGGRIFRLDNLIVNPAGSEGTRFLMATVAFEVETEAAEAALKEHEVQVRDLVVSQLESQTMQMLTRAAARDSIKRQLGRVVASVVGPKSRVTVYLPQFVIQ